MENVYADLFKNLNLRLSLSQDRLTALASWEKTTSLPGYGSPAALSSQTWLPD